MPLVTAQGFSQLASTTTAAYFAADKKARLNESLDRSQFYYSLLAGKGETDYLTGGKQLTRTIKFSAGNQSEVRKPLQSTSYAVDQDGVDMTVYLREWHTPAAIAEVTIMLNEGEHLDDQGRFMAMYDSYMVSLQNLYSDHIAFGETLAFQRAWHAQMEAAGGAHPYSLPALYNEFDNGLTGSGVDQGATAWTTVHGITPGNYPETNPGEGFTSANTSKFQPQRFKYTNLQADDKNNLINAHQKALMRLEYRPPQVDAKKAKFFQWTRPTDFIGIASQAGISALTRQYQRQGMWTNTTDFAMTPRFGPWQYVYVPALDTAAIYPTGSAAAITTATASTELDTTNTTATNGGPRFYLLNRSSDPQKVGLNLMFQRDRFFKEYTFPFGSDPRQYDAMKIVINCMGNNFRGSGRRAGAFIFPGAHITD